MNIFVMLGTFVKKIPSDSKCFTDYFVRSMSKFIYVEPVSQDEIIELVTSLDCKKSYGPDGINIQLLQDNKYLFGAALVYIFNLSLTTGVVPDKMELAK